jgi:hypothetical protein
MLTTGTSSIINTALLLIVQSPNRRCMMDKLEELFSEHFAEIICVLSVAFILLVVYGMVMS